MRLPVGSAVPSGATEALQVLSATGALDTWVGSDELGEAPAALPVTGAGLGTATIL